MSFDLAIEIENTPYVATRDRVVFGSPDLAGLRAALGV
jgi:hypothetical protein